MTELGSRLELLEGKLGLRDFAAACGESAPPRSSIYQEHTDLFEADTAAEILESDASLVLGARRPARPLSFR